MNNRKILLLGSTGLIGRAVQRKLAAESGVQILAPSSYELDLRRSSEVQRYFEQQGPSHVIHAAGKNGGVFANVNNPSTFSVENTLINTNVLQAAFKANVKRLIQYIPACVYPLAASLPYKEDSIGTGIIEETSKYYAYAKLNTLMMAQAFNVQHKTEFISLIPSNVYGPDIKATSDQSHVIPSLINKMLVAVKTSQKNVEVWGNGRNQRDFLYVDDLAEATLLVLNHAKPKQVINVASGEITDISNLAEQIRDVVGFKGDLNYKDNGLSGAQHKYLDTSHMQDLGWKARTSLKDGIRSLLV